MAYRQCHKRLWLEVHRKELRDDSGSEMAFAIGYEVGDVSQDIYNEEGNAVLIDIEELGFSKAFAESAKHLQDGSRIVFEAGMQAAGALAFADVMIPEKTDEGVSWRMVEVKASTSVKEIYHDDIAVQNFVAESAGIKLSSISLAHVDNQFVYQGDGDYKGLLYEVDLTDDARSRRDEVAGWLDDAQTVVKMTAEPEVETGDHCSQPYDCPFIGHCNRDEEEVRFPLSSLPNFRNPKKANIIAQGIEDLREVPNEYLSAPQLRVKDQSLLGEAYFDQEGATNALANLGYPAFFLDFETVMLAVPIWKGTRPYQQIPFQYSLHHLYESDETQHEAFLDLSGSDPSGSLASSLIKACGSTGPVFVYNAGFEKRVMRELAERFPEYADGLTAIIERVVDLLPVARNHYYHPDQHGSWSLKAVLPAICPDLSYGDLDGVSDGGMAVEAYKEILLPGTTDVRKQEIEEQLLTYCELDTLALVRIWEKFRGGNVEK